LAYYPVKIERRIWKMKTATSNQYLLLLLFDHFVKVVNDSISNTVNVSECDNFLLTSGLITHCVSKSYNRTKASSETRKEWQVFSFEKKICFYFPFSTSNHFINLLNNLNSRTHSANLHFKDYILAKKYN